MVSFDESASSSVGWSKEGVEGREGEDACGGSEGDLFKEEVYGEEVSMCIKNVSGNHV